MTLLWTSFVLLVLGVLIGVWCLVSTLFAEERRRDGRRAMSSSTETRLSCIGAAALLISAAGFALAALARGA